MKEKAWLDLTSSWSIKDLERSYKTFLEICCGSTYDLFVWVIMNATEDDPRTKANAFRVPLYESQDWDTMLSVGTYTIKDMTKALAAVEETISLAPAKTKKIRH